MLVASYRNTEAGYRPKFRPVEQANIEPRISPFQREHEARMRRIEAMNQAVRAQIEAERLIALERANAILAEIRGENARYRHTVREIERRACKLFKVRKIDLRSNRRYRTIMPARQFVMYWAARLTELSLPRIGRLMGGRDHTTVLHGRDAYREKRAKMGRNLRAA